MSKVLYKLTFIFLWTISRFNEVKSSDLVEIDHEKASIEPIQNQKDYSETQKVLDVSLVRQRLVKAISNGQQDIVEQFVGCKRVGLLNRDTFNYPCCRINSLVSCLYNIPRFREVLYSSDHKNEPSLKLAQMFVQMQLGNTKIDTEASFVKYFKDHFPDYKKTFWYSFFDLRTKVLEILPNEAKNLFQVSLRISDSNNSNDNFEEVTKNFVTISRSYKSISEAISSNFASDVHDNLDTENDNSFIQEREKTSYNQVEIKNRPEVLFFGIMRSISATEMELDLEITLPLTTANSIDQSKYILQAFSYSDDKFQHHMSAVRDLSPFNTVCEWYKYNDSDVSPTFEEKYLQSMKAKSTTNATFAFYVRSDVAHTPIPVIPEKLLP